MSTTSEILVTPTPAVSGFKSILGNKDAIRIVVEIVTLLSICYYFNSKYANTLKHIEDLSQRIEDQDDIIENNSKTLTSLMEEVDEMKNHLIELVRDKQQRPPQQITRFEPPQQQRPPHQTTRFEEPPQQQRPPHQTTRFEPPQQQRPPQQTTRLEEPPQQQRPPQQTTRFEEPPQQQRPPQQTTRLEEPPQQTTRLEEPPQQQRPPQQTTPFEELLNKRSQIPEMDIFNGSTAKTTAVSSIEILDDDDVESVDDIDMELEKELADLA